MIDFVKLNITHVPETTLRDHPDLDFRITTSDHTGEVIYPLIAEYHSGTIRINPTRTELRISLHKLWNSINGDEPRNSNDFSFSNLTQTIEFLESDLSIDPAQTIIENIEYGVNIETENSPSAILDNVVLCRWKQPSVNTDFDGNGRYIQFEFSEHLIKIYNKSRQYEHIGNTLRVEKKVLKNRQLQRFGISTLSDLMDVFNLDALQDDLMAVVDGLLIVDEIIGQEAPHHELEAMRHGTNPRYWSGVKNEYGRMHRNRILNHYRDLLSTHNLDKTHREIRTKVRTKWTTLMTDQPTVNVTFSPTLETEYTTSNQEKMTDSDINQTSENVTFSPVSIEGKRNITFEKLRLHLHHLWLKIILVRMPPPKINENIVELENQNQVRHVA